MKKQFMCIGLLIVSVLTNAARFENVTIPSKLMNKTFKARIIIPDSYDGKKSFKQIYLLHGAGDSFTGWHTKVKETEEYADKYQCIIICPTAGKLSWYNNFNKSEDYIIKEVIPLLTRNTKHIQTGE